MIHIPFFVIISEVALENLASLEAVRSFKSLPSLDRTSLDADHLLVAVLWRKIADCLGTLLPGVPHNSVLEIVPNHIETRLAVNRDGCSVLLQAVVDAIDCLVNCKLIASGVVLCQTQDLVEILDAGKTCDLDLCDVLAVRIS